MSMLNVMYLCLNSLHICWTVCSIWATCLCESEMLQSPAPLSSVYTFLMNLPKAKCNCACGFALHECWCLLDFRLSNAHEAPVFCSSYGICTWWCRALWNFRESGANEILSLKLWLKSSFYLRLQRFVMVWNTANLPVAVFWVGA